MGHFCIFGMTPLWSITTLTSLLVWDIFWKVLAMWRAARNGNVLMYVLIIILNTAGILPILYLVFSRRPAPSKG